jgi:hypothetical protein
MATPGGGADGTGEGAASDAATDSDRLVGIEPVGAAAAGATSGEPIEGEPIEGEPVAATERLLGRAELAQVLRFVQAGYRIAGLVSGAMATTALLLGLLVWTLQSWTWPGRDGGRPWVGLVVLAVLLLPAGAFGWTRRRCRRAARVAPADLEADLTRYGRTAVDGMSDLADATRQRRGESRWRRPARVARRAYRLRDLFAPDAVAIRTVLGPFAPGAVPLLWLGAVGTVLLLFVGLPAAIAS